MPPPLLLACLALLVLAPSAACPPPPPLRASFLPPAALLLYGALPSPPSSRILRLRLEGSAGGGAAAEAAVPAGAPSFALVLPERGSGPVTLSARTSRKAPWAPLAIVSVSSPSACLDLPRLESGVEVAQVALAAALGLALGACLTWAVGRKARKEGGVVWARVGSRLTKV